MNFLFVSYILWVKECKEITTNSVTFTRDLVRQGHGRLQVTVPISDSIHASMYISRDWRAVGCYLIAFPWPIECKKQKNNLRSSMYTITLPEISKVTCDNAWPWRTRSRVKATQLVVIWLHSLTHRMQETRKIIDLACILPEIGKVTCNHAWPWRKRSRVKVTELVVISLHSLTHRMQETKKSHRSSMYTTRDRKGHL